MAELNKVKIVIFLMLTHPCDFRFGSGSEVGRSSVGIVKMKTKQKFASQKQLKWKAKSVCAHALTYSLLWTVTSSSFFYIISQKTIGYALISTTREKSTPIENEIILPRELNLINIIILLWSLLLCLCARSARLNAKLC